MVAWTLACRAGQRVTVLDLGGRLDADRTAALARMTQRDEAAWDPADLELVTARSPVNGRTVPRKRTYGSDHPFLDLGQAGGIRAWRPETNVDVVSSAYGGFTNVWGAQVMPFSPGTFRDWPVSWQEMQPHYRAALDVVPLAAEVDGLAETFPLLNARSGLPPLGPRAEAVLQRYAARRTELQRRGVTVGRARLAFRADECTRCGLCMTGCPHDLIYSAAQTMDRVRRLPNVRYIDRVLVERIGQDDDGCVAHFLALDTGTRHELRADRLFVGAGAMGTTRLVLGSLPDPPPSVTMAESRQFVVPFLSGRPVADPRRPGARDFTLNQFNILLSFDAEDVDTAHVHCYPYNPAFADALPAALRHPSLSGLATAVLRRLTVGFGYLPSWASPAIRVTAQPRATGLPDLELTPEDADTRPRMLGPALRRLARVAPALDLWPLLSSVTVSGAGKSYHFGSTFPHRRPNAAGGTDRWGRLAAWDRIHLVDGSVLPTIASTTFTLTVMANAGRIATEVLDGRAAAAVPTSAESAH
jgi:ferredoxin